MNRVNLLVASFLAATSLLACTATGGDLASPPKPPSEVSRVQLPDMPDGHPDPGGLAILSRGPRRMSVDQLERSIEQIGQLPPGAVRFPPDLAVTLGRPDFIRVTEESLDPSPLFMKFMLDLGGLACTNLGDADPQRPPEERVLTRFSDIDQNVSYLILRFTGLEGAAAAPYAERLKRVYQRAATGPRGAMSGWQAVCIALFTSPEFLLY